MNNTEEIVLEARIAMIRDDVPVDPHLFSGEPDGI
jgi:hypothetical protein